MIFLTLSLSLSLSLRYLLPALSHLSAEEGPRQVLLGLDTPALLVCFLERRWGALKGKRGVAGARDPSMETACSSLLNFAITEADRVGYCSYLLSVGLLPRSRSDAAVLIVGLFCWFVCFM